ncbi:MAG: ABC transporter substrate-binding protein [Pseudomonadota bacterium]|nr:ABC transporter substrate-binding protein [Pseudomonadota bacterium]
MWLLACVATPPPTGPRVVSLHDTTTEIVVGLGHAGDLIAITEPRFLSPEAEAAVRDVPRLPSGPVSEEAILALHPTRVLGTDVVTEQQPELADLPGAVWIDPAGLAGLWTEIGAVAAAVDAAPEAYVARLQAQLPAPVVGDVPVFLYDCCDPPFTMGGRAPLGELLTRLGAHNLFTDLDTDWAHVGWEAVAARRPALVVVSDYAWKGQADTDAKIASVRAHLGDVPTITLPLALALEGARIVEAADRLRPAIEAAR